MTFQKQVLAEAEKCYAVSAFPVGGEDRFLFASEAGRPALAFDGQTLAAEEIPVMKGGTMSMVPLPDGKGFLAIEGFYPPFDAAGSRLVLVEGGAEGWRSREVLALPYLHRFGTVPVPGGRALVLSTLCGRKAHKDDWSSPGCVYAAPLDLRPDGPLRLVPLLEGQFRNHGFFTGTYQGRPAAAAASDQGIHLLLPPLRPGEAWEVSRLTDGPAGEVWLADLDGDGQEELIAIEPFHGSRLVVYHREPEGSFAPVWELPEGLEFAHALWCGTLWGRPCGVCGSRRGSAPLLRFFCEDGRYHTQTIEAGASSANVAAARFQGRDCLLSANHGRGQCAMYLEGREGDTQHI